MPLPLEAMFMVIILITAQMLNIYYSYFPIAKHYTGKIVGIGIKSLKPAIQPNTKILWNCLKTATKLILQVSKNQDKLSMLVYALNPSTGKADVGETEAAMVYTVSFKIVRAI